MSPSAISESYKIIALSYDTEDSDASARRLISALKPEWDDSPGPVDFVKFKEGITNTVRLFITRPEAPQKPMRQSTDTTARSYLKQSKRDPAILSIK